MPLIGNACSNEIKASPPANLHGGEPGNQRKLKELYTGIIDYNINDEVRIQSWSNLNDPSPSNTNPRPLQAVFRFKDPKYRQMMAQAMINACSNPFVGYDDGQTRRQSFRNLVGAMGYSVESLRAVKTPCDCDCSSLVSLCFYCVTGRDINTDTANMSQVLRNTGLCDEIKVDSQIEQTGAGLIPGDICVWRSSYSGHATVVVNEKDDISITYNAANITWISGITGVVITDDKKVYGQDKKSSLSNSTNAFRIYALDNQDEIQEISKVIVVDKYGSPKFIYGFAKLNFGFNLLGDSRTVQFGTLSLERNTTQNALLYGIIPDENIFAWWGCNLVDLYAHSISREQKSVKGIVYKSSYSNREGIFSLWLKNGSDNEAFKVEGACPDESLDLSSYEAEDALSGKMVTLQGFVEQRRGVYGMPTYEKFFSPSPNDYSCPIIKKVENAESSTSTASTIDQIITIMEDTSNTYQKFTLSQEAERLVRETAGSELVSAAFWFGINDIQIYKDAFLGNLQESGQTKAQSQQFYIRSFVEEYRRLLKMYLDLHEEFDGSSNNLFVVSIVSTSDKEKDYFEDQGEVISAVNGCLKDFVEVELETWQVQSSGGSIQNDTPTVGTGGGSSLCWLQYVELNRDLNGNTIENAQDFVEDSDFRDNIHFTREWFEEKYLPVFGFSSDPYAAGEAPESPYVDYSALAPKDWPCASRDKNWYMQNYPQKILDWFVSQGYSAAFAIGVIANMRGESYFCPWICGDYSSEHDVSSKLWITVNGVGVPAPGYQGNWFEPGGYSDFSWRDRQGGRFSRVYRTQGDQKPSSFGFCQWHNTVWAITYPEIGSWQSQGIDWSIKRDHGRQAGRGARMMNFCENLASYKAPWSANPIGQLEFLVSELPAYSAVWNLKYIENTMTNARHVADVFCRVFEQPPNVNIIAEQRANRAEGYWNWLILGGPFFGG